MHDLEAGTAEAAPFASVLPPDTIPLGFGCAALLGPLSVSESENLLAAALDSGITYFDTARMYGSGGAEAVLGRLTATHRARMIVVSKAGILPPSRAVPVRAVKKLFDMALRPLPNLQKKVLDIPPMGARLFVFDLPSLNASLEKSLRELGTDYLDILLLHEVQLRHCTPELLSWVQGLKQSGKIRAFGLASEFKDTQAIVAGKPEFAPVTQFPNSVWLPNIAKLPLSSKRLIATHSCLGSRFGALCTLLSGQHEIARLWSEALGIDVLDRTQLAGLLLQEALASNPNGLVLFSSSRPANFAANAELARAKAADPGQLDRLRALVRQTKLPSGKH